MKKIFFILIILLIVFIGGGYVYGKSAPKITPTYSLENQKITSPLPEENATVSEPKTLIIPKLDVRANVESVGLDSKRNMDVPKKAANVGWYNLGTLPGKKGNAVLAGHFDTVAGLPAVFFKLDSLESGDEVQVEDQNGNTFAYRVVKKQTYPTDKFPLQEVFGDTNKSMLNLITCTGAFDKEAKNYSHRTVVYSELVE